MTKYALFTTLLGLAIGLTTNAVADTYRWVDDNGIVNYSERKPRDIDESRVTLVGKIDKKPARGSSRATAAQRPTPTPGVDGASNLPAQQDNLSPEQQKMLTDLQSKEAERQAEIAKIREDNCARSRRVLDNLSAKSRIRVRAADGTQRTLGEDERQERIAAAQRGIVENC